MCGAPAIEVVPPAEHLPGGTVWIVVTEVETDLWLGRCQPLDAGSREHIFEQRQLVRETHRIYPNETEFRSKVVVRKGRENYLCLLNLEDALQGGFTGRAAVLAQLVARWAAFSSDGDMIGGDLPGWLPTLFRRNGSTALTDRRGECIYAGCPHYKKCFIA